MRPGAAIAAGLLALGLSAGCVPDVRTPPDTQLSCTDEARPDGTCYPPSRQTVQDWVDLGVSREAINRCLLRHPDGDAATELCVWSYVPG